MAVVNAWMSGVVNTTKTTGVYEGVQQEAVMDYVLTAAETVAAYDTNAKVDAKGRRTVALASAARTADATSDGILTLGAKGVRATLYSTALASTPSVTMTIQGWDATAGAYYTILTSAAIVAADPTATVLTVYPGIAVTANVTASTVLPDRIRIFVDASNTDSLTYSVGLDWLD